MSLKVNSLEFKIVDGPSRDRLFDVCKYTYDQDAFVVAVFKVGGGSRNRTVEITSISMIQHECGNGESFNIEGTIDIPWLNKTCEKFSGYYNSKSRSGHLKIIFD
jgi:hypothetical protein